MTTSTEPDAAPTSGDIDDDVLHCVKFWRGVGAILGLNEAVALCGEYVGRGTAGLVTRPTPSAPKCPICVELNGGHVP